MFASKALTQLFMGNENREGGGEELAIRTKSDLDRSECSCIGFHSCDTSVDYVNETHTFYVGFSAGSLVKNPPAMQETWVLSLC